MHNERDEIMTASQILQEMHDRQQADLANLTQWQRVEYAIVRRTMTHVDALAAVS